jgi:hypothetical protein
MSDNVTAADALKLAEQAERLNKRGLIQSYDVANLTAVVRCLATALEQAQAENARYDGRFAADADIIEKQGQEIIDLKLDLEQVQAVQALFLNESMALGALDDCAQKLAAAEAENKRLREALAKLADWQNYTVPDLTFRATGKNGEGTPWGFARAALHPEAQP